jgi:molybdopterin-containing oxidoreductase family membrane subunit
MQFAWWRATGWMAWIYWILFPLNVLSPLLFVFRKFRRNIYTLFVISILVNIGMWLERALIVIASTSHDFLPHNWGQYFPTWVEACITLGSFTFFLFWFFLFSKAFPTVAISDIKEELAKDQVRDIKVPLPKSRIDKDEIHRTGVLAIFSDAGKLLQSLDYVKKNTVYPIEVYSPLRLSQVEGLLKLEKSPVRFWTLGGALAGVTGGFALVIGSALVNELIVGGKHPVLPIPYCIVGFEGLILLGALGNLIGLIIHARLGRHSLPEGYDPRFSQDRFGLLVTCAAEQTAAAQTILTATEPEEIRLVR